MSDPRDFAQIELVGEELNIFVIGPGYGEVILIDLPGPGWLVIDGAGRTEGRDFPAHALLEHHLGDDFISAMVLTHPHGDHYRGMRELIDHEILGSKLRRVGCVTKLVDEHGDSMAPSVRSEAGSVRALLERINSWWAAKPEGRLPLEVGPIELECNQVELRTLAPTRQTIDGFLHHDGRRERIRRRANELSVVLELRFGEGRYLFTGDLPEPQWRPLLGPEGCNLRSSAPEGWTLAAGS